MSAIKSPQTAGTALSDKSLPGRDLDPAQYKGCFHTRLNEIFDKLDAVAEGEYNWVLDEDLLLPPQAALDYCRREAETIARLLSFRDAHPCREMIPSPAFRPYGEDGEIRLEWCKKAAAFTLSLESGKGLSWRWYHASFSAGTSISGSVPTNRENLWDELQTKVSSAFAD